jgi:hypothetical protein
MLFCHAFLQVPSSLLFRKIVIVVFTPSPQLVMLGQVKPGEEVETQGRISALLASGLASWRGSENQEPSSPLDQVSQGQCCESGTFWHVSGSVDPYL